MTLAKTVVTLILALATFGVLTVQLTEPPMPRCFPCPDVR
jgi:hypothetical protein